MGMLLYLGGALVAFFAVARLWDRIHYRRLAARRAGENFETFRAALAVEGAPETVLRAVYEFFQRFAARSVPDFPVRADDYIDRVYSPDPDALGSLVKRVIAECGYSEPSEAERSTSREVTVPPTRS